MVDLLLISIVGASAAILSAIFAFMMFYFTHLKGPDVEYLARDIILPREVLSAASLSRTYPLYFANKGATPGSLMSLDLPSAVQIAHSMRILPRLSGRSPPILIASRAVEAVNIDLNFDGSMRIGEAVSKSCVITFQYEVSHKKSIRKKQASISIMPEA